MIENNTKFQAVKNAFYHFEIGAHSWNQHNDAKSFWIDISVYVQKPGSDPVVHRKFKDYSPYYDDYQQGGRRYVEFTYDIYMPIGTRSWLHNNKERTIITGPDQYKFTWMAYMYTK